MRARAEQSAAADPSAAPRRYCKACSYELEGLTTASCPECGRAFDPTDPETYLPAPANAWKRSALVRRGIIFAAALLIASAFMHTILPRPRSINDWRLWLWFGMRIGLEENKSRTIHLRAYFWLDRATYVEGLDPAAGTLEWSLDRDGEDDWTFRVLEPGLEWGPMMAAFNNMKAYKFGIVFPAQGDQRNAAGFEVRGSMIDVMSALVTHYRLEVTPFRIQPDQSYIWTYDDASQRMVTLDLDSDTRHDFPLRRDFEGWPLAPKPVSSAEARSAPAKTGGM